MRATIAIVTARSEAESDYKLFQKHAHNADYQWEEELSQDIEWQWAREECIQPQHETFLACTLESLGLQSGVDSKDLDVVIIDRYAKQRATLTEQYGRIFGQFRHIEDKPSMWHTMVEPDDPILKSNHPVKFTAVCNARNTAYVVADSPIVFHLDDHMIPAPRYVYQGLYWWEKHKTGMKGYRHIVKFAGNESYDKVEIDDSKTQVIREFDSWYKEPLVFQPYPYNQMYGHANTVPLEWAFHVNGWDERLDGNVGCEDLDMGFRMDSLPFTKMVSDRYAKVFELGSRHIQWQRPHVKYNCGWMDYFRKKHGLIVKANQRVYTKDDIGDYMKHENYLREIGKFGEVAPTYGNRCHPYIWKTLDSKPFILEELRKQYHNGELKW